MRELILFLERHGRLSELVNTIKKERPDINLPTPNTYWTFDIVNRTQL